MKTEMQKNFTVADLKEYAAILVIKALIAIAMFAFSTAIVDVFTTYINKADGWMKKSSQTVSRNIIDLYR